MPLAGSEVLRRRDTYRFGDGAEPVLRPGTIGWSVRDLDDPTVRALWDDGRYEIVDGVLAVLPPAYFGHGMVATNLNFILREHFRARRVKAKFSGHSNVVIDDRRVARVDGVAIVGGDIPKFEYLYREPRLTRWCDHVLTLPPTLIVESVSTGREEHDRVTKRRWYAEFGVPNYWIVDGYARTLECLRLAGGRYELDVAGRQHETVAPSSFPGLSIALREVWED